jgi:hypothetical protein
MTRLAALPVATPRPEADASGRVLALALLAVAGSAALLAGWLPVTFSIVTVFLFAGPHNWVEFRYFLTRLPGRWGKLRGFFLFAFGGVLVLTGGFAALRWLAPALGWDGAGLLTASAVWNTLLLAWVVVLVQLRSRQNPRRDWAWTVPVALALAGLAWLWPPFWALALVYLHPLMALWILDRELRRSRPQLRRAYHACLLCLPVLLGVLWWRLAGAPPLPGEDGDPLTLRITWHAGGGLLRGVPAHLLVATHTFLEMIHYGVWLVAIPLVGLRAPPWRLQGVPMARRSGRWRVVLAAALGAGAAAVLLLWACFLVDYPVTRDVYFTVALLHVLAEVPFLLRAL